ncbi:hypothetical protein FQA47_013746 [Oryzias melastigma]|uniref:Uncharacterized protein n=1 Tax=Oryzias melastigma TaxID=30732 RepID=A0A834FGT7_ORYME|nr:hypothetical protein FQA47_013746 [Oryzias melastigma]
MHGGARLQMCLVETLHLCRQSLVTQPPCVARRRTQKDLLIPAPSVTKGSTRTLDRLPPPFFFFSPPPISIPRQPTRRRGVDGGSEDTPAHTVRGAARGKDAAAAADNLRGT